MHNGMRHNVSINIINLNHPSSVLDPPEKHPCGMGFNTSFHKLRGTSSSLWCRATFPLNWAMHPWRAEQWVACPVVWVGKPWMENADEKSRNQESKNKIKTILDPCNNQTNWIGHKNFARVHVIKGGRLQKRENPSGCVSLCQVQNSRVRSFAIHNLQGITRPLISYLPKDPLWVTMHSEPWVSDVSGQETEGLQFSWSLLSVGR